MKTIRKLIKSSVILAILSSIAYAIVFYMSTVLTTITVTGRTYTVIDGAVTSSKERYTISSGSKEYECATCYLYCITDPKSIFSQFELGKTYRVRAAGWDVPLLGWNKVIIECITKY